MNYIARYGKTFGFVADLITMVVGYFIAYGLVKSLVGHAVFPYDQGEFLQTEMLCFTSWALGIAICLEQYPSRRRLGVLRDFSTVLTINMTAILVFAVTVFLLKQIYVSRMFMLVYVITQILLMCFHRYAVRWGLYMVRKAGWNFRTRIVVGANQNALQYMQEVVSNKRFGLRVIGYIADETADLGLRHLGSTEDIGTVLTKQPPDGVVIALDITDPKFTQVVRICEILGISMELLLDSLSSKIASSSIYHGINISSLELSSIPHTPTALLIKRVTDIVLSVMALLLSSPLFLCVALAIKFEDRGPVFFAQERVGLRNKPFKMFKFRSMRVDAETMKESLMHLNEMSGPVFKLTHDPRVTRVGAFIRRTSLDELPQFLNVLMGNMSLVGPRPPLPSEVARYEDAYRRRLSVKPGLTCLWQVNGRNEIDFDGWMALDLTYIDNWSYFSDWKIMFRTIPAVLKRHGAR